MINSLVKLKTNSTKSTMVKSYKSSIKELNKG